MRIRHGALSFSFAALVVTLLAVAAPARAALINVDFQASALFVNTGTQTGAAATGAAGDVWNPSNLSSGGTTVLSGLLASDGSATGVSLSVTASGHGSFAAGPFAATALHPLMDDELQLTGPLQFAGLTAGGSYELYVYSQYAGGAASSTTFTVGASVLTASSLGTESALAQGVNYVHFASVQADPLGHLSIGVSGNGFVNGLQLRSLAPGGGGPNPVPLPAAVWGGLALGGFVLRRARRG